MNKIIKQAVGIDCGKQELVASIGFLDSSLQTSIKATSTFSNDERGCKALIAWVKKYAVPKVALQFVAEPTGVYHERLCYYVTALGYSISIVLPNRAASFLKTLQVKTINDRISASGLALMGLEKKLDNWNPPNVIMKQLKQLCREREELIEDITSVKNQLHALNSSAVYAGTSIQRLQQRLAFSEAQLKEIEQEMKDIVAADADLKQRFDNVCTIKGVGLITAIIIVAETDGFSLIRNQRQLVSYAGLDVIKKQSGTSVNSAARISHRGNRHIRRALHFPSLAAMRFDENMQNLYGRLLSRHNIKMKAAVAVQRKLLVLIYTIWKKNEPYNPKFLEQSKKTALIELAQGRS
ncbi:MAG: IS110 family transposase [Flavipsychrobacter sp.]